MPSHCLKQRWLPTKPYGVTKPQCVTANVAYILVVELILKTLHISPLQMSYVVSIHSTVEPLYKGHPRWWPFKRGGLSWGVKYTWFVKNGARKWTKFYNFSETFPAFPEGFHCICKGIDPINGLVQDCSNSSANALELLQACTKSSIP